MKPDDVQKVGVIGCGIMGSGIVEVCAKAGTQVTYVEVDDARVERGRAAIEKSVGKAVERGKLSEEDRGGILSSIHGTTSIEEVGDADLIIEAVPPDLGTMGGPFRNP